MDLGKYIVSNICQYSIIQCFYCPEEVSMLNLFNPLPYRETLATTAVYLLYGFPFPRMQYNWNYIVHSPFTVSSFI